MILGVKSQLREHQSVEHSTLMRWKDNMFHCYICDYQFPTKTRLNRHVKICEEGRTRTLFRKQISDVLEWIEKGSYRCTFCQVEFHPVSGDATLVSELINSGQHYLTFFLNIIFFEFKLWINLIWSFFYVPSFLLRPF